MSIGAELRSLRRLEEHAKAVATLTLRVDELTRQIEAFAAEANRRHFDLDGTLAPNRTVEAKPEADVEILEENAP